MLCGPGVRFFLNLLAALTLCLCPAAEAASALVKPIDLIPQGCSRQLFEAGLQVVTDGRAILKTKEIPDQWYRAKQAILLSGAAEVWAEHGIIFDRFSFSKKLGDRDKRTAIQSLRVQSYGDGALNRLLREQQKVSPEIEWLWAPFMVFPFQAPRAQIFREGKIHRVFLPLEIAADPNSLEGQMTLRHEADHAELDHLLAAGVRSPYYAIVKKLYGFVLAKTYENKFTLQELHTYARDLADLRQRADNLTGLEQKYAAQTYESTLKMYRHFLERMHLIFHKAHELFLEDWGRPHFFKSTVFFGQIAGQMTVGVPSEAAGEEDDVLQIFVPIVESSGIKKSTDLENRQLFKAEIEWILETIDTHRKALPMESK